MHKIVIFFSREITGPPTPATVNAAPQPHYMPMFIHLPYALPVSSQQPHVPPPVSQQPPRAQQQLMRNSPPKCNQTIKCMHVIAVRRSRKCTKLKRS